MGKTAAVSGLLWQKDAKGLISRGGDLAGQKRESSAAYASGRKLAGKNCEDGRNTVFLGGNLQNRP